ncbi:sperm acrosome membrane-associated protein 4-like [Cololabis saira]|uniref:sperm acrosome membrane-associated protein 4-like n=1 Tax=Cololabis saira TaxID=129043 RepID=UPI002AD38362|nr:sperm acrosome membrane-associated protein 4-like [Cololabis saira]
MISKVSNGLFLICSSLIILCEWVSSSVDRAQLLLTCVLLVSALVLPALQLDSLVCYFCPMQEKSQACTNVTSHCLPDQRCSTSKGHYGAVHVLSAQGCVDAELCGSHEVVSYRGVEYNVSHTCCCRDKCNSRPKLSNLKKLMQMIKAKMDKATSDVLVEEPWDSCENYTLSRTTAFPAIKS